MNSWIDNITGPVIQGPTVYDFFDKKLEYIQEKSLASQQFDIRISNC